MQSVVRLGALGAGGHGKASHFAAYEGATLVAAYDLDPEQVRAAARLVGHEVAVCASAEELVARDDIDAILVLTPDKEHPAQLKLAVESGKPVLCEKPLAIDQRGLASVDGTLDDAEQKGRLVASCHPRRNQDPDLAYGWIKTNLAELEQRFGRLRRVGLNSIYSRPSAAWKYDRSFLMDKFVHDIDYLRFLLGDRSFTAERVIDGPDHYEVEGEMAGAHGPVRFVCQGTRLHSGRIEDPVAGKPTGEFIEVITLNFLNGEVAVYTKTGTVRVRDAHTDQTETIQITPMRPEAYDRMFRNLMKEFVEAVQGGPRPHTPADLRVNTASVVMLASPEGAYSYGAVSRPFSQ